MKKQIFYFLSLIFIGTVFISCDKKNHQSTESETAKIIADTTQQTAVLENDEIEDLLILSMMNSRLQFELAGIAQGKATTAEAKTLTGIILSNSTKVQEKINSLAQSSGVAIPAALTPQHQAELQRIKVLQGAAFDQAYASLIVQETQEDIKRYEEIQTNANNPLMRGLASETLELLRAQLEVAQKIKS